ncbi:MAG: hypothetical protein R2860_02480 [Desulfobacterales bacterium]
MFLPEYLKKNGGAGGEKGSITIMVAFLLPVMLLMLMMIVNINQLVFTSTNFRNTVMPVPSPLPLSRPPA